MEFRKWRLGARQPFFLIAGPCVIESEEHALGVAARLREITSALDVPFIFKASYDKANRTSIRSFRGPGLDRGLEILGRIRRELGVAVTSDVHEAGQVGPAAEVLDLLQNRVTLTTEERTELKALTRAATKTTGKRFLYARALMLCDRGPEGPGWTVARVAEALGVSARTLERLKRQFVEQGLEFALERKRRVWPPRKVIFDGALEARLVALACFPAPPGRTRWTLRLLAEKVVELGWVERVSVMTVQRTQKKPIAASSEEVLADPTPGQRRLRSLHGGRFRSLCPSVRPPSTGRVHG